MLLNGSERQSFEFFTKAYAEDMRFKLGAHSTCDSTFAFESCIKTVSQSASRSWMKQVGYNTMKELQTRELPFAGTADRTFEERLPKQ